MAFQKEQKNCINCSCKAPLFKYLTSAELQKVNAHRYEIEYYGGEIIFKQNSPATHVLSFTQGLAKINLEHNEKRLILGIIKPGTFIAGPGMHIDKRHHYSIVAMTDSKVCAIDQSAFIDVLRSNREFMTHYIEEINIAYLNLLNRIGNQAYKQVKGKVADAILYLSENIFNNTFFRIPISTREIAELSGVSHESAARTLKEFSLEKIISFNRQEMKIINLRQLKEISRVG
ncbi:MAG: Crp/Fnr family transcriptional regulator [Bacteroidota bacterium]|nr:Crp/Fnr family transcriptional regulator [Bacteroidota bacterium]